MTRAASKYIVLLLMLVPSVTLAFLFRVTDTGATVRWRKRTIDVHLSPSLETIASGKKIYPIVEDVFETWVDEAGIDLEFNFVYAECTPGWSMHIENTNCVHAGQGPKGGGARASVTYAPSNGNIQDADVKFYQNAGVWLFDQPGAGVDFRKAALHEVGHFLGLRHSEIVGAAMFPVHPRISGSKSVLHDDDTNGIAALYEEDTPPSSCSHVPSAQNNSLFSLVFSLF